MRMAVSIIRAPQVPLEAHTVTPDMEASMEPVCASESSVVPFSSVSCEG
jgi:hypothetical protein